MARLSKLTSTLAPVSRGVAYLEQTREQVRAANAPWRTWYKTTRWQKLRMFVLVGAGFTCARCHRVEGDTSQLVADHMVPHRGDEGLFWEPCNLQCLCKRCHDSDKQREERAGRAKVT
ncbi:HNH endonuclease [Roseicyclus sp.]|uniref:HNH endonuclease n=1 Tax=Roseicyclus sp. TaxID=1914329 RepID=UPI003F6AECB8